jgi:hypothetical protein
MSGGATSSEGAATGGIGEAAACGAASSSGASDAGSQMAKADPTPS